jgi:hypothetical protein
VASTASIAAGIARKNPQAMRRAAAKAGLGANFAGMASNIPGPVGAASGVVNMGLGAFQAGATAGASFGSNREGVRRVGQLKSAIAARDKVIERTNARIKDLTSTRSAFEVERTKLLGRIGDSGSKAQQRTLKSLSTAINKKNGEIATAGAKLTGLQRRNASLTRGTKKIEGLLGGQYNTAEKIYKGVEQTNNRFRAGRRQTAAMRPKGRTGPKKDPRSWQERLNDLTKDEAERADKKCGKSGIPDNAKCTKQTAKGSTSGGSGAPKNRSLLNRAVRTLTGASKQERIAKYEKEQAAREKKYGKHSPDANGGEALAPDGPLGRLLKKKGIDPNKIGGNSDLAIELAGKMEQIGKSEKNFRFKSGTKIPKLPAQYLLRKDSEYVKREDKKCGNSGIPDNAKCSKKSTARTVAKVAATAALVAGGVAAVKSRSRIKSRFRKTGLTSYQSEQLKKMRAKGTGTYGAKSKRSFTAEQKPYYTEADRPVALKHKRLFRDAEAADAEGKKYSKTVTDPKTGRKRTVKYGAKGYTIAPGTKRGNSYCARSFGDMKSHNKNCAGKDRNTPLCLSRAKWKCSGKTSR